jgi:flagellar basal-body rod modification protein FlgD
MVASVSGASGSTSGTSSLSSSSAQDIQNEFLTLLVAQLKNQDPLNPMDNSQVTSQMAQLSMVQGIQSLNDNLSAYTSNQGYQAADLIGHYVVAPGNSIQLAAASSGSSSSTTGSGLGGFNLAGAADSVKVNIYDSKGKLVRTMDMGAQKAGVTEFSWDGKTDAGDTAADGSYTFKVQATSKGESVTATSLSVGEVMSVMLSKNGTSLSVSGLGLVNLSDVQQVI